LRESIPPRESAAAIYVANENWREAGNVKEVLSSTHLILGDVARAIVVARQALEHANNCPDGRRLASSAVLAGAMACAGDVAAGLAMLKQAELEAYPQQLAQFGGYRVGDLLLAEGEAEEALRRGRYHLAHATRRGTVLHGIGFAWLLIGRAEAALGSDEAGKSFDAAVEGLRRAGMAQHLPLALLARAAHLRERAAAGEAGLVDKIRADLDEVEETAEPEMRLFLADLALERARVAVDIPTAFDDWRGEAFRHVAIAARLIAETGYHMRDDELAQLQSRLAATGSPPA
jgi:tetratricopeptide (TPR) repeat protein